MTSDLFSQLGSGVEHVDAAEQVWEQQRDFNAQTHKRVGRGHTCDHRRRLVGGSLLGGDRMDVDSPFFPQQIPECVMKVIHPLRRRAERPRGEEELRHTSPAASPPSSSPIHRSIPSFVESGSICLLIIWADFSQATSFEFVAKLLMIRLQGRSQKT